MPVARPVGNRPRERPQPTLWAMDRGAGRSPHLAQRHPGGCGQGHRPKHDLERLSFQPGTAGVWDQNRRKAYGGAPAWEGTLCAPSLPGGRIYGGSHPKPHPGAKTPCFAPDTARTAPAGSDTRVVPPVQNHLEGPSGSVLSLPYSIREPFQEGYGIVSSDYYETW